MTKNFIVIDDDENGDPTNRFNYTSHQITVNDPEIRNENTDEDVDVVAYTSKDVVNFDLNNTTMSQSNDHSVIVTSTFFSLEILENDSEITLEEERQLHPSIQEDFIVSFSNKRSHSLNESDRVNDRDSDWVFNVFVEDDNGTEDDGSSSSKRVRSSTHLSEVIENQL